MSTPFRVKHGLTVEGSGTFSDGVVYDNTTSGLTADRLHEAVDEVNAKVNDLTASEVDYVNTTSGLTATNVQDAIDELDTEREALDLSLQAQISQVNTRNAGLVNIAANATTVISSIDSTIATSAEWLLEISKSDVKTLYKVMAVTHGGLIAPAIESTADVGTGVTTDITITVAMNGTVMELRATNGGSDVFYAKFNRIILT